MTREEAIKQLDTMWKMLTSAYDDIADSHVEAYTMAVDALKAQMDKPMKLSTVCLLCKKPAVTFSTDDDIPYTNYSYCEDCLRKGLKLLKAHPIMALPSTQPDTDRIYAELNKAYNVKGLPDEAIGIIGDLMLSLDEPSAQPEEDCDTCKHGYFGDDQCNNCRVRYPSHYKKRTDER